MSKISDTHSERLEPDSSNMNTKATPKLSELSPIVGGAPLAQAIAKMLRERILSGDLRVGQQVVQAEIARQLKVSRAPVREALNQLLAEGLIREVPRHGTFVYRPGTADIREVFDLRVALEVRAAQLIIENLSEDRIRQVETLIVPIERAVARKDVKGIAKADVAFHEQLIKASGNRRLHQAFVTQARNVRALLSIDEETYYDDLERLVHEHRQIVRALRSGSKMEAQNEITAHIEGPRNRLIGQLRDDSEEGHSGEIQQ